MADQPICPPSADGYSDCNLTQALLARARERSGPPQRSEEWKRALSRAKAVKLLLLDVDGVLTDGTIFYTAEGGESKGFNTQDGFGLRILQEAGVEAGLITARTSEAVARRAADLKLAHLYQGRGDKAEVFREILARTGLRSFECAYMGDDWLDLPLLGLAGFSAAPANAVTEVRQRVDYVCSRQGGRGAVREVCDLILEARGELDRLLKRYGGR